MPTPRPTPTPSAAVLVLVVVVVVWWAQPSAAEIAGRCEPRGTYVKENVCLCSPPYTAIGMKIGFLRTNTSYNTGFVTTCCKYCRCDSFDWFSRYHYAGKRSHHPALRPFSVTDDRESLLKDNKVRELLGDPRIGVALGAFQELSRWFPECQLPTNPSKDSEPTLAESIEMAHSFLQGCSRKWAWASQFHNPANVCGPLCLMCVCE